MRRVTTGRRGLMAAAVALLSGNRAGVRDAAPVIDEPRRMRHFRRQRRLKSSYRTRQDKRNATAHASRKRNRA